MDSAIGIFQSPFFFAPSCCVASVQSVPTNDCHAFYFSSFRFPMNCFIIAHFLPTTEVSVDRHGGGASCIHAHTFSLVRDTINFNPLTAGCFCGCFTQRSFSPLQSVIFEVTL